MKTRKGGGQNKNVVLRKVPTTLLMDHLCASSRRVESSNSIDQRAGRRVCLVRPTVAMHRRGYDDDDDKYSKAKAKNIRSHAPSASNGDGCVPNPPV